MYSVQELKNIVKQHIFVGCDVNTDRSSFRFVKKIDNTAIIIPKGQKIDMTVTWEVLHRCYTYLYSNDGYSNHVFKKIYPELFAKAGCYVNTIGQILMISKLANSKKTGHLTVYRSI